MRLQVLMPLCLSLIILAGGAATPPVQNRSRIAAGATATVAPTAGTTGTPFASPTPASLPTSAAQTSTAGAAPPWIGLPVRTYANLKKHILGDPVNIAFEGTRPQILAAFRTIGWVQADPLSLRNDTRLALATLKHGRYPTAPVSNLYLFGRREDFAVEHELRSVYSRDHARLWDTQRTDPTTGRELFIGDASQDIAIKVLRDKKHLPIGTTHKIAGDVDAERDRIVRLMQQAGLVQTVVSEPGMGRTRDAVNGGGDHFYTDGRVLVIVLKSGQ